MDRGYIHYLVSFPSTGVEKVVETVHREIHRPINIVNILAPIDPETGNQGMSLKHMSVV